VVSRDTRRRWAVVLAGVAVLAGLPAVIAAWPVHAPAVAPDRLRGLIVGSADRPFEGYAEVQTNLGLPDLPAFGDLTDLSTGTTRMRAWYAAPSAWRIAVITTTGETDTYQTADSIYIWDFERNLLSRTTGVPPARLPRASDLLPTDLARRLLRGSDADAVTALPARRVAGISAPGLRLVPSTPGTTIGRVDVWADPLTGLPLRVELAGRTGDPVVTSAFVEVTQRAPAAARLVPPRPDSIGFSTTSGAEIAASINGVAFVPLPQTLAGQPRLAGPVGQPRVVGLAAYGVPLAAFAAVAVPGRIGGQLLQAARDAGGVPVSIADGEAYQLQTSVLSVFVVRGPAPDGLRRRTYLLAGWVTPELLQQAGIELAGNQLGRP
jgi:hypothetical protein